MKRDLRLNPLSWQHQRTLALAHRTGTALDKASAPLESLTAEIDSLWRQEIEPHFRAEETILFPPAQALGICRDEIEQVLQEHQRLRELVGLIERGDVPADLRCHLREFAELLIRHIRFEERTVFPALEKALPKEQLEAIGRDLSVFHEQTRPGACPAQPSREAPERQ
jgi:iron-sulfur cluster repair protein YtfE (RIC family)